ncbi:MAG: HlyD family efflux transporter periplasmic adaptor subunit [Phycisphaerales bacterium]|nr:HlyD family efflux transporter periplasmic adaptor subunit [Phycisphaerales bacterium]
MAAFSEPVRDVTLFVVPATEGAGSRVVMVANGKIVSDRQVNVATKVSGQIVELNVEQGDTVEQNHVLARVEDVVYRAQRDEAAAVAARRNLEVAHAGSERARARAAIVQARADLELERRNYDRLERLHASDQASDFEFDNARNKAESAAAALDVAVAEEQAAAIAVNVNQAEADAAGAGLRQLQQRLDDCAIRAPIPGVILERNAQVGDFLAAEGGRGANANAQLVKIADMTLLRVEIDVSERDVQRIYAGQAARITPDAAPGAGYDGAVMWIDPIGDYAKATVQAKVRIHKPGAGLRVDGSAKVEFLDRATDGGTVPAEGAWIPKSAVQAAADGASGTVYTVAGDRAVATLIAIGARTEQSVEALSGVRPGMQLIGDHLEDMHDGTPVRVVPAGPAVARPSR